MEANFKLSLTEYREVTPYKIRGLNIYSIEEAIYTFYNNWKEFSSDFFEDKFINWVKNEILDNNLVEKLNEIKNYSSFYEKSIEFLTINNFYTSKDIEAISLELFNWEKRGQSDRLKTLGDRFFNENLFEKAIKVYCEAIDFEVTNSILYNNVGICYIRIKKYELAFKYLKKAFELDNKNCNILYNLIECCILNKDENSFFYYINYINELNLYYSYLAEFNYVKESYGRALANFSKSYLLKRDYKIIIRICDIYIKKLDYINALKTISFFNEESFEILTKKSEIYENMKNYNMAIKYLEKANLYEKDNPELWLKLAKLYREEYELMKSEGAIFKANILLPDNDKIIFEQALIKKAQGKFKEYQTIISQIMQKSGENYRKFLLVEKSKNL